MQTIFSPAALWTTAEGHHSSSLKSINSFFSSSPSYFLSVFSFSFFFWWAATFILTPIFSWSVCGGNVTWRSWSVYSCTCSKWVHLRSSLISFSRFKILCSSHSRSVLLAASLFLLEFPDLRTPCLPPRVTPAYILSLFNLAQPASLYQNSTPIQSSSSKLLPSFRPLRISSLCTSPFPHVSGCFAIPPASLPPLLRLGFFNQLPEVSKPGELNYYTLSRLILWFLSVSRNPTLIHLPLSGFTDSLLCDLIVPTPGLAFFFPMTGTLAMMSSFLSGMTYPSLNFLPPFSLRLTSTLIM